MHSRTDNQQQASPISPRPLARIIIQIFVVILALTSSVAASNSQIILPPEKSVLIEVGKYKYRAEAGYFWSFGTDDLNKIIKLKSLDFYFWMPDRRFLKVNPSRSRSFRPTEPGLPIPPSEAYIVKINQLREGAQSDAKFLTPDKRYSNLTSSPSSKISALEEPSGLVRFWDEANPNAFINYRNTSDSRFRFLLRCTLPEIELPNQLCSGYVYSLDDDISFYARFPRIGIEDYSNIFLSVVSLTRHWKRASDER